MNFLIKKKTSIRSTQGYSDVAPRGVGSDPAGTVYVYSCIRRLPTGRLSAILSTKFSTPVANL